MSALVIRLVDPPAQCSGYLKRYLVEVGPHCYCGAIPKKLADDLIDAVKRSGSRAWIAVLDSSAPFGLEWLLRNGVEDTAEVDGVVLSVTPSLERKARKPRVLSKA